MFKLFTGLALCAYEFHVEAKQCIVPLCFKNQSVGTCFAISSSGLAITTEHCIKNREATTRDGLYIKIIGRDKEMDIAILQLPAHMSYPYLKLGDSDSLVAGEEIYHYGFALNSLVGMRGFYQGNCKYFMYGSTEMMHGQSGGPVLNAKGQVVGVCKGHFNCSPELIKKCIHHSGSSIYVPANRVKKLLEEYCEFKEGEWVKKSG